MMLTVKGFQARSTLRTDSNRQFRTAWLYFCHSDADLETGLLGVSETVADLSISFPLRVSALLAGLASL